jgi:hypothetical protein
MSALATIAFDYSALDSALADDARTVADRIRGRLRSACLDTGRDLIGMKDRLGHGHFGAWLKAEFDITERSAENYMNAFKFLEGKSETVSYLPPSIIYKLAAPSAPAAVVAEVVIAAEAGMMPAPKEIKRKLADAILAERVAEVARQHAAAEAAKSPKATQSRAAREAREAADRQAHADRLARMEQERADRLRPLADRIIAPLGASDVRALVNAMNDYPDRETLWRLLREATTIRAAT